MPNEVLPWMAQVAQYGPFNGGHTGVALRWHRDAAMLDACLPRHRTTLPNLPT